MSNIPLSESGRKLKKLLQTRAVFLDGAMGTLVQREKLSEADFRRGLPELESSAISQLGNNDILNLTRPDIIAKINRAYYDAGSDIVTTGTFGANLLVQSEYGNGEDLVRRMNARAVEIAKAEAAEASARLGGKELFVAGSIGPMNKSASISADVEDPAARAVDFDELVAAYTPQMESLYSAGVDVFLVETAFDTLNVKAALYAYLSLCQKWGERPPIGISMTVSDASGRILSGQTIEAFYASIRHAEPIFVGLNCALGADKMRPYVEVFDRIAECYTHCYPNAGMPNPFSESGYDETPEMTASKLSEYAREGLVNIFGGCCGTTPKHIEAIVRACSGFAPRKPRERSHALALSGLEPFVLPEKNAPFAFVGERTNVMGSAAFRKMIKEGRFSDALSVARGQVENGANIIDVNFDEGMLDSPACMKRFLNLVGSEPEISRVPIMIDSSDWNTIVAGLKCVQGKPIVNSISLKNGEGEFLKCAGEIKKFGAAAVVMAFDEQGQATTLDRRVEICVRAYGILVEKAGFNPEDIIFDANVLTVATGMAEHDSYGADFIEAVRRIKAKCPYARTSAGVSNISFAFRGNNPVREAMHSVFLYHARNAGLDMGIVNAGMLAPYDEIDPKLRKAVEDVVLNTDPEASERLLEIAGEYKGDTTKHREQSDWDSLPWNERLMRIFIKGEEDKAEEVAMHFYGELGNPLEVIEKPLMSAMRKVGELFGEGKMFLPQVVKSARVMKRAVAVLEPYMPKGAAASGPKVVVATVKGDVHDIGKNIVSVVLSCNGFRVEDLGVMVEPERIVEAARGADIVGLSGLITPSLDEMARVVQMLEREGLKVPVMVGGATTSDLHAAVKLAPLYSGTVVRVEDAGLSAGVCASLTSAATKKLFEAEVSARYGKIRAEFEEKSAESKKAKLIPYTEAVTKKFECEFPELENMPKFEVKTAGADFSKLEMPWYMYLRAWKVGGAKIPEDLGKSNGLDGFFKDTFKMLEKLAGIARPKIRYALYGARPAGDDVELYDASGFVEKLCFMRSQRPDSDGKCLCLADYVAPSGSFIGMYIATVGREAEEFCSKLKESGDEYSYMTARTICDMAAEALSEYAGNRILAPLAEAAFKRHSADCGCPACKTSGHVKLSAVRPAVGYPAYPDHSEKAKFKKLLDSVNSIGVDFTENFMMTPVSSVCAVWIPNPRAKYFSAEIGYDQLEAYARRKGSTPDSILKYLSVKPA